MPSKMVIPGATRASVIVGLKSVSSPKWALFLKEDGPYWNYMYKTLAQKKIMCGRDDLRDEAVNEAICKLADCLAKGKFVYAEAGKGYFRAFLKIVVVRAAYDILRKERLMANPGGDAAATAQPLTSREERAILSQPEPDSPSDERKLDSYDATGGVGEEVRPPRKKTQKPNAQPHPVGLEDLRGVFDDDGSLGTKDPAAMAKYEDDCSNAEYEFLRAVRLSVFRLALASVLANERIPVRRRRILVLLYLDHLKPAKIYKMDEFAGMNRNAFDQLLFNARGELERPVLAFWREVAPESCRDSEHRLKVLWSSLSNSKKVRKAIADLRKGKTGGEAGGEPR